MDVRTPKDIGALIRATRRSAGLGQADLAAKVGVSRQWLIGTERGKPRAELGLVLATLAALGIRLSVVQQERRTPAVATPDLNAIVTAARKKR